MTSVGEKTATLIRLSFYLLFLLTPLIFTPCTFLPFRLIPCTFELFEFNKMMFIYALTTIIAGSWLLHTVATKTFSFRRTPFDIPLLIFFLSQTISTFFSIERHTSLIGYYSRFHGGLFSTTSYLILFYAFVTFMGNHKLKAKSYQLVRNCLILLLTSGSVVSAYATLQHFGIDAHLWVQDVQRRVFSTLGQPNWLAAFLIMLLPLTWAMTISNSRNHFELEKKSGLASARRSYRSYMIYDFLFMIFFLALLYTKSRSGVLGFALAFVLFWGITWLKERHLFPWKKFLIFTFTLVLLSFFDGLRWIPTISNLVSYLPGREPSTLATPAPIPLVETGGSDSGVIRKIVWQGALAIWRRYPIVGSGVETFAYSYYNFRPTEHNLVSEWDFLYNKAHNEYLNLLATTGLVGLGSYLLLQWWFVIYCLKQLNLTRALNFLERFSHPERARRDVTSRAVEGPHFLLAALLSGYAGLSVSNFLGFSTVTVGWLSFMWPAVAVVTQRELRITNYELRIFHQKGHARFQIVGLVIIILTSLFILLRLAVWWYADTKFALGKEYEDASLPSEAYPLLAQAVRLMPQEPTFRAELSKAAADLAYLFYLQEATESAATMSQLALAHSDITDRLNPVHINLIKSRVRVLLTLSQFQPELLKVARTTLDRGIRLAPTDPKLYYNLALLEMQKGDTASAEATLQKTLKLKPNYEAARFAYGTFLEDQQKYDEAAEHFQFILDRINPENQLAIDHLKAIAEKNSLP